jgi:tetratricopeptide (TPR) repeat protein
MRIANPTPERGVPGRSDQGTVADKMMNRRADQCPDAETIAVYLDRGLPTRGRADFATHLAGCETCYFMFTEAAQLRKVAAAVTPASQPDDRLRFLERLPPSRAAWKAMAAAVGMAACAMLAIEGGVVSWPVSDPAGVNGLVAAVGNERPVEARLSGGFAYGPLRGATRSGDATLAATSPDVRIAAAHIEKQAIERRTMQTLSALGTAYLVQGDIARAITALEQAADQRNPDARILNDLAAAYLARGARDNHLPDFAKALTLVERATAANPRLAEGWFNRAYALERLASPNEARQAWEDYLKVDPDSEWAAEARRHVTLDAERHPDQRRHD